MVAALSACGANLYSIGLPFYVSVLQQERESVAVPFATISAGVAVLLGIAANVFARKGPASARRLGAVGIAIGMVVLVVTVLAPKVHWLSPRHASAGAPNQRPALDAVSGSGHDL